MPRSLPDRPTFEGRPLAKPDEELVDQGFQFDVVTLMSRRRMLRTLGLGAVGLGLAACSTGTTAGTTSSTAGATAGSSAATGSATATGSTLTEIPDETAGPYPGDGSNGPDVLEQSGIVRSDLTSSFGGATGTAEGVPMTLTLSIKDMVNGNAPFAGVAVYAWHCTADGLYSMYSDGVTEENFLRGVQIADDAGQVTFSSIVPGCYSGRWPHVHFEVYPDEASITDSTKAIATSQVAIPEDVSNAVYAEAGYEASVPNFRGMTLATDNVFGDDGGIHQLGAATGSVADGYTITLDVPVDTSTTPTGGNAPMGDGAGPGGQAPPSGAGGRGETPPSGAPGGAGGTPPSGGPGGAPPTGGMAPPSMGSDSSTG